MGDNDYSAYNKQRRDGEKLRCFADWAVAILMGAVLFGFFLA